METSSASLMDSSNSALFQSAVQFDESGELSRSALQASGGHRSLMDSALFMSVMHDETPEQTMARLREERGGLQEDFQAAQGQIEQATEVGLAVVGERDEAQQENEELSRQLSATARELEHAQYRIRELETAMQELDEQMAAREAEAAEREAELQAQAEAEPEPAGSLTASGTFLTKSESLRKIAVEKDQRAATAEAIARAKEALVLEYAAKNEELRAAVHELQEKNEAEIAFRVAETVRELPNRHSSQQPGRPYIYVGGAASALAPAPAKPLKKISMLDSDDDDDDDGGGLFGD
jgi:chromosome segregation ATPase